MEFLKVLFENGAVTWDQFAKGVKDKGLKIADLSEGNYVSKQKMIMMYILKTLRLKR